MPTWHPVKRPTGVIKPHLEVVSNDLYARCMADSLDTALAPLVAHIRGISDERAQFEEMESAEERFLAVKRMLLQEMALGLRAQGKKWKEIGEIMGGVTYQRAFQIGRGQ